MQIKLTEDFSLSGDKNQFVLYKKRIIKEGKNAGNEEQDVVGYFQTLEGLLNYLLQSSVRQEEGIKTLTGMHNYIEFNISEIKDNINKLEI